MEVFTTVPGSLNGAALRLRGARSKSDVNGAAVFEALRRQLGACGDQRQQGLIEGGDFDVVPGTAPADELFHSGRLTPLKLPPRLQSIAGGGRPPGSRAASPTSALSAALASRSPFTRFGTKYRSRGDPFVAALEKVRKEEAPPSTRARSLSPLRTSKSPMKQGMDCSSSTSDHTPNDPSSFAAQQSAEHATAISSALHDGSGDRMSSCSCEESKMKATKHFNSPPAGRRTTRGTSRDQVKGMLRKRSPSMAPWRRPFLNCFGCS